MRLSYSQFNRAMNKLPLTGKSDMGSLSGRSSFSGGVTIKMLPLSGANTRFEDIAPNTFEDNLREMSSVFRKGLRSKGVIINSMFEETGKKKHADYAVGSFDHFTIDRKNKIVRAFIRDPKTQKLFEVYPASLQRLNESIIYESNTYVKSINEFRV